LRKLGVVTDDAEKVLGEHSPQKLVNRKDIEVGEVAAEFELEYR